MIAVSNSEFDDAEWVLKPQDLPPTLRVSNLPCWRLSGQATYDFKVEDLDEQQGYSAQWFYVSDFGPWPKAPTADGQPLEGSDTFSDPKLGQTDHVWRFTPQREP